MFGMFSLSWEAVECVEEGVRCWSGYLKYPWGPARMPLRISLRKELNAREISVRGLVGAAL